MKPFGNSLGEWAPGQLLRPAARVWGGHCRRFFLLLGRGTKTYERGMAVGAQLPIPAKKMTCRLNITGILGNLGGNGGLRGDLGRAARVCGEPLPAGLLAGGGGECKVVDGGLGRGLNFRIRLNKMPARPNYP